MTNAFLILNVFNSVTDQLHEGIIIGELSRCVGNISRERKIFLEMVSYINHSLNMTVVMRKSLVFLIKTFSNSSL
ncbi:Uncharacterised protein [Streptococcus pneumoniae]|nr:Uncharacterised protein [Streptococcus pneumoniae]